MQFGVLVGTTFVPSVSDKRNGSSGRGELASQIPEECWHLSNCQNLRTMKFPLNLTNDQNMNNYVINIETFYSIVLEVDFFFCHELKLFLGRSTGCLQVLENWRKCLETVP